jgi:hypothetical protein
MKICLCRLSLLLEPFWDAVREKCAVLTKSEHQDNNIWEKNSDRRICFMDIVVK